MPNSDPQDGVFAYAKFRENKSSLNAEITLSFTDICKSCPSRKFLTSQICLLTLFAKIKKSRKFTVTVIDAFHISTFVWKRNVMVPLYSLSIEHVNVNN